MKLVLLLAAVLQFHPIGDDPTRVTVTADPAAEGDRLTLHRLEPGGGRGPAMFAEVASEGGRRTLSPLVPLSRGESYVAVLSRKGVEPETRTYTVPEARMAVAPRVKAIHPRADQLPANLLKFYLYFDQPMREGREIFDLIQLIDDKGKPVHAPWRRMELWSKDATRLTLWVHPGRVKQGVNLREQLGPVLHPGRRYTLRISGSLRSASGVPMGGDFERHFTTLPEDHTRIQPDEWTFRLPVSGGKDALSIQAGKPLDHALLERHLSLRGPDGREVPFGVEVGKDESMWSMIPRSPWKPGRYRLLAGEYLEDLCGNTPARVFDTDLQKGEEDIRSVERVFWID